MSKNSKARKGGPPRNKRGPLSRSRRNQQSRRNQRTRRNGGAMALEGAPIEYRLAGSWPSRMSLGQGQDYFKYHVGQHGGYKKRRRGGSYQANMMGASFPKSIGQTLPQDLRMAAHIDGLDKAIAYSRQFKDPGQAGGRRRRNGSKRNGSKRRGSKRNGSKRSKSSRRTRRRGGSMGYAPFPNKGMLLDTQRQYAQAGLNPQWKTDVAFDLAKVRLTQ